MNNKEHLKIPTKYRMQNISTSHTAVPCNLIENCPLLICVTFCGRLRNQVSKSEWSNDRDVVNVQRMGCDGSELIIKECIASLQSTV